MWDLRNSRSGRQCRAGRWRRSMAHRGPDGEGCRGRSPAYRLRARVIAGSRSSILLRRVRSRWRSGRWWITYNGELYNFPELRRELEARASGSTTQCDTEVLLRHVCRLRAGDAGSAQRDLRVRNLGRPRAAAVPRSRSTRRQAALLHGARRDFAFASELKALLPLIGSPTLDRPRLPTT